MCVCEYFRINIENMLTLFLNPFSYNDLFNVYPYYVWYHFIVSQMHTYFFLK